MAINFPWAAYIKAEQRNRQDPLELLDRYINSANQISEGISGWQKQQSLKKAIQGLSSNDPNFSRIAPFLNSPEMIGKIIPAYLRNQSNHPFMDINPDGSISISGVPIGGQQTPTQNKPVTAGVDGVMNAGGGPPQPPNLDKTKKTVRIPLTGNKATDILFKQFQSGKSKPASPYLDYRKNQLDYLKTKMRDQLIKEGREVLNPYFQKGAGQDNAKRLDSISRAKPLVEQMLNQPGGGDPRQMVELATALDRVIKGGGQSAQSQIEHLIPQTALGKGQTWIEWLSNNPTGLQQEAFIKRYRETLDREEKAIKDRVTTMASSNAPTLRVLKEKYPGDFDALIDSVMKNSLITSQGGLGNQQQSFNSVQEAEAANLPKGTRIIINGRSATVQ